MAPRNQALAEGCSGGHLVVVSQRHFRSVMGHQHAGRRRRHLNGAVEELAFRMRVAGQRGAAVELSQFEVIGLLLGQNQFLWGGPGVRLPVHAEGVCHPAVTFSHSGVVRGEVYDVLGCHVSDFAYAAAADGLL